MAQGYNNGNMGQVPYKPVNAEQKNPCNIEAEKSVLAACHIRGSGHVLTHKIIQIHRLPEQEASRIKAVADTQFAVLLLFHYIAQSALVAHYATAVG